MAPEIAGAVKRPRGRPRSFDRASVLVKAVELFWEHGYEGTSFDDLIAVMGISASSFYSSFGGKENLYREATATFMQSSASWFFEKLNDTTVDTRTAFEQLLNAVAAEFTRTEMPAGCMISIAATHVSPGLGSLRQMMTEHRAASELSFAERLRAGKAVGDLPGDTDVEPLAAYFSTVVRGMAVQARDGASRKRLSEIVKLSMRVWPV